MAELLTSFIKFLDDNRLIDFRVLKDDTDEGFNNRLRAQKYVFFGQKRFNLGSDYSFTKYKFGPYSARLTDEYYGINIYKSRDELESYHLTVLETPEGSTFGTPTLPAGFDVERFLDVVSNRSADWLEIAATIINISDNNQYDRNTLLDTVNRIKPRFERTQIESVYTDLVNHGLMGNP